MRIILLTVVFSIAGCRPERAPPKGSPEEEAAREKVRRMGGAAHRESSPGYPVIDVYLCGCKDVDDDSLAVVSSFPKVREMTLTGTSITDKGLKHLRGLN